MDWSRCGAAVFRSTWDYFERFDEFEPWLGQVSQQTRLINDAELIRWNIDKRYLADLERAGVAIVPTHFLARAQATSLADVMQERGWDEVVFKPRGVRCSAADLPRRPCRCRGQRGVLCALRGG